MKKLVLSFMFLFVLLGYIQQANATLLWFDGEETHAYTVLVGPTTWSDAWFQAEARGGYLAAINSEEEQKFIFDTLLAQESSGSGAYAIGAHWDSTTDQRMWYGDGQELVYTNWASDEPDFYKLYAAIDAGTGKWKSASLNETLSGYLVEAPVPEPATMLLLGSGLIGLAGLRRKFRR